MAQTAWQKTMEERDVTSREAIQNAAAEGVLSHVRLSRVGTDIAAYVHDATSPTGVRLLAQLQPTPDNFAFIRRVVGVTPLSPTEAR